MPPTKIRDNGRVQRLISIAYLLSMRTEMHIDELIERTGSDRKTIEADLNILMYCGLPPYSPGELFDIYIDDDYVSMMFNEVFLQPLRLTEQEKSHTVISLKKLQSSAPDQERQAIDDVIALIDESHGQHIEISSHDIVSLDTMTEALEKNYCLELEYLSLHSASLTQRIIEPIRIFTTASVSYLYGYCRTAQSRRLFRSDRIVSLTPRVDLSIEHPRDEPLDIDSYDGHVFSNTSAEYVDFIIGQAGEWMLDTYPHEVIDESRQLYRFYGASPYFAARILLSHHSYVSYAGGTLTAEAIVNALNTLEDRMQTLAENENV